MAMSAHSDRLDQFEEGNAAGELEAILYPAVSPSMTPRRFPSPWHADPMPGGYVVRDATGQVLAYIYSRETEADARQAVREGRVRLRRAALSAQFNRAFAQPPSSRRPISQLMCLWGNWGALT
jgi:hypothetical protein